MKISSLKAALVAAFSALLFALPASAANYWNAPMEGAWQMSGAGGNDWLLGVELGTTEKINFYKAFNSVDVGAFLSYDFDVADFDWGYGYSGFDSLKIGANLRFKLMEKNKFDMALSVDPALDIWFSDWAHADFNMYGLSVDLRLTFGIKIVDRFRVHAGLVVPFEFMFVSVGDGESSTEGLPWVLMPVLAEAGAEFKILPWLSVMLDVRLGPGFKFGDGIDMDWENEYYPESDNVGAWFAWETRAGVAFRF